MPQPPVDLGRTDEDVIRTVGGAQDALIDMLDKLTSSHPGLGKISKANQRDLDMARCLNPNKIAEEFDRVRKVAIAVGDDAELIVRIEETKDHLAGWQGAAADAFRAHMVRMREFATETQQTAVRAALQHLGELFSMAYHMRQSYCDLATLVTSAAQHEIDEHHERIAKTKLAIGKEFVKGVLSFDPDRIKDIAVDFLVESTATLADYWIEGTGVDAVVNGYLQGSERLSTTFEDSLRRLTKILSDEHGRQAAMAKELRVLEPINQVSEGLTDVGSPRFSYANFYTEEYPRDGPFAGQVAEERTKYTEDKRERDSEINRRLEDR